MAKNETPELPRDIKVYLRNRVDEVQDDLVALCQEVAALCVDESLDPNLHDEIVDTFALRDRAKELREKLNLF